VLDVCFAGDAHIGDVSSSVGAQGWNINRQVPGVGPGSTVRRAVVFPFWGENAGSGLELLPGIHVPGFTVWHTVGS